MINCSSPALKIATTSAIFNSSRKIPCLSVEEDNKNIVVYISFLEPDVLYSLVKLLQNKCFHCVIAFQREIKVVLFYSNEPETFLSYSLILILCTIIRFLSCVNLI